MTRIEDDKEDLIADATALLPRAEYTRTANARLASPWNVITVGVRRDLCVSLYLDQDPFYQFDQHGGLRRAYVGDFLYRSGGKSLTRIHRVRTEDATKLASEVLSADELAEFRRTTHQDLTTLSELCRSKAISRNRSVPENADPLAGIQELLTAIVQRSVDEFLSAPISPR